MTRVAPISPLKLPRTGGWLAVRATPSDGSCGVHGYPCQHPGLDVLGAQGTLVHAPEDGLVQLVTNGASPPFVGYGPWVVVIRGDSGVYHLLAHLEPAANRVAVNQRVVAGDVVGATSSAGHTHWEVRRQIVPPAGQTNQQNNLDPQAWLAEGGGVVPWLLAAVLAWGGWKLLS